MTDTVESERELIREQARRLLADSQQPEVLRRLLDTKSEFDRELWASMAALGWMGLTIPEEFDGLGMSLADQVVIAEELGRVVAAVPYGATLYAATPALLEWGSHEQKQQWLPKIAAGEAIGAFAFAETGEAGLPVMPGVSFKDGWLDGEKVAVSAGAFADFAIVQASSVDGEILVLVDLHQIGVDREVLDTLDNSRGIAHLRFHGATAEQLPGSDRAAARRVLANAALMTSFEQVGGAQACLFAARDYALQRRVFGQPIGAFQAIKHRLADLYTAIEVARGNALAGLDEDEQDYELAGAAARIAGIRAYDFSAQEALQVHGAIGVTWEADLHLHYRRARTLGLEWGSQPYWRERLVSLLVDGREV